MREERQQIPISVVITTYNDGDMLAEALESVADQHAQPGEVLVIDDGSAPATAPSVIRRVAAASGLACRYVWQENAGPSAARNTGLRQATGDYIAYLDSDDRWLPSHLGGKLARLEALGPEFSTAYDGFREFDDATGADLPTLAVIDYTGPIDADLLGQPNGIPAGMPFQLHRRAALLALGGFDETLRINEDFDLLLRLAAAGHQITGTAEPTVLRRVHPNSATRIDPARTLAELDRFLAKAERAALLTSEQIASKRKWARLALGKQQVARAATAREGIETLRAAFTHARPKGLQQWAVYGVVQSTPLASALFAGYRWVHSVRNGVPV